MDYSCKIGNFMRHMMVWSGVMNIFNFYVDFSSLMWWVMIGYGLIALLCEILGYYGLDGLV